ncbi:isochorismatase family protein [Acinetobacter rudis]|uniref:Isochorismatase family protein n=1 Tax=Acinetobacter rudis TaxID=632955 RepID=A0AAW8J5R6_9GAMM|nr:isochorismatase family protein [Acinetobacter rudis]MDQ8934499.1 isochorismatase family protein [Acinetobacter rudis]MDQ8951807.1 isochorismatase family protein [Acinetobacter rudis]MDQ9016601.1 isochorismatase family protein [Acinetobacter rudis]
MTNTALLVIDVQNDYFANGKMALHNPEIALKNIQLLEQYFRQIQQPVIYIQHIYQDAAAPFFVKNTHGVKLHAELQLDDDPIIIVKHYPNSFFQTQLQQQLERFDITKLVITGMMTHMCVDATTRAARELGYDTVVVSDATATKSLQFEEHIVDAVTVQHTLLATLQMLSAVSHTQAIIHADGIEE